MGPKLGKPQPRELPPSTTCHPGEGGQAESVRRVLPGPTGGGRLGARPGATANLRTPKRPWPGESPGRAGVEAVPLRATTDTSGLASRVRNTTVRAAVPMRARRALGTRSLQCSLPDPPWPRPPALALASSGPESLVHFSFSDEDIWWHPSGRSVRWVARGQSPPFLPKGSG